MKEGNQPFNAQKALRVACLVLADLILINLSAFLALYIRFEFDLKLLSKRSFCTICCSIPASTPCARS